MNEPVREQIAKIIATECGEPEHAKNAGYINIASRILSLLSQGDEPPKLTDEQILAVDSPEPEKHGFLEALYQGIGDEAIQYQKKLVRATLTNFMPWHNAKVEEAKREVAEEILGELESGGYGVPKAWTKQSQIYYKELKSKYGG